LLEQVTSPARERLPPVQGEAALDVQNVSHTFGLRRVLDDVNVRVEQSRFCVLLGLNGAGKTTLFSLITRLYNNRSGRIAVLGHDVRRQPAEALRRLGVVFQSRTLDLELSISQNLAYHAALHGMPARLARERAAGELERAGLADRADEKVRNLSGGQMRRVEIARALLHRPRLLLLDEPTVGLDIAARADILARVRRLVADDGLGVLWATHLIDEVDEDGDVVVLHRGRVLQAGPVRAVLAAAGTASLTEAFTALTGNAEREDAGASHGR
jgi:ABC-2 type transport system ATP-binding protein